MVSRAAPTRMLCCLLLAGQLAGCMHWQLQSLTPQQTLVQRHPVKVRVTTTGGTRQIIEHPTVVGDSLSGAGVRFGQRSVFAYLLLGLLAPLVPRPVIQEGPVSFALTDVSKTEIRQVDVPGTLGVMALVAGTIGAMIALAHTCVSWC